MRHGTSEDEDDRSLADELDEAREEADQQQELRQNSSRKDRCGRAIDELAVRVWLPLLLLLLKQAVLLLLALLMEMLVDY